MRAEGDAFLAVDWPATGVGALTSTRAGGVSSGPWATFNLGDAAGDDPAAVAENRRRFAQRLGVRPVYLRQVHGARVVEVGPDDAGRDPPEADAAVTDRLGVACVVQFADCLPVLLAAPQGRAVGAAHAGWRGLAAGVVERALARVCALGRCAPGEVAAWLGPCIGPRRFEVGAEVLQAFGVDPAADAAQACFVAGSGATHPDGRPRWLADLAGLARQRLEAAGVRQIAGAAVCTHESPSAYFSFRRDRVTGRHAAAVWRLGG
jgi:YfiH family protein